MMYSVLSVALPIQFDQNPEQQMYELDVDGIILLLVLWNGVQMLRLPNFLDLEFLTEFFSR